MFEKGLSPYLIISTEGLFGAIVTGPLILILFELGIRKNPLEDIKESLNLLSQHKEFQIGMSFFFIGHFIHNILRIITNQRCSPTHLIITDCLSTLLAWIIHISVPSFRKTSPVELSNLIVMEIGYVIIFLSD